MKLSGAATRTQEAQLRLLFEESQEFWEPSGSAADETLEKQIETQWQGSVACSVENGRNISHIICGIRKFLGFDASTAFGCRCYFNKHWNQSPDSCRPTICFTVTREKTYTIKQA